VAVDEGWMGVFLLFLYLTPDLKFFKISSLRGKYTGLQTPLPGCGAFILGGDSRVGTPANEKSSLAPFLSPCFFLGSLGAGKAGNISPRIPRSRAHTEVALSPTQERQTYHQQLSYFIVVNEMFYLFCFVCFLIFPIPQCLQLCKLSKMSWFILLPYFLSNVITSPF